jgi:hypothetical protein
VELWSFTTGAVAPTQWRAALTVLRWLVGHHAHRRGQILDALGRPVASDNLPKPHGARISKIDYDEHRDARESLNASTSVTPKVTVPCGSANRWQELSSPNSRARVTSASIAAVTVGLPQRCLTIRLPVHVSFANLARMSGSVRRKRHLTALDNTSAAAVNELKIGRSATRPRPWPPHQRDLRLIRFFAYLIHEYLPFQVS